MERSSRSRLRPGCIALTTLAVVALSAQPAGAHGQFHLSAKAGKPFNHSKQKDCPNHTLNASGAVNASFIGCKKGKGSAEAHAGCRDNNGTSVTCFHWGNASNGCNYKAHGHHGAHAGCPFINEEKGDDGGSFSEGVQPPTPATEGGVGLAEATMSTVAGAYQFQMAAGSFLKIDTNDVEPAGSLVASVLSVVIENEATGEILASGEIRLEYQEERGPGVVCTGVFQPAAESFCLPIALGPDPGTYVVDLASADFSLPGVDAFQANTAIELQAIQPTSQDVDFCLQEPPGMIAWWPLDEQTGATVAQEIVNGNDGSHVGGPTPVVGIVGRSLLFDGTNDRVLVPHSSSLNVGATGDLTVDAWVRTGLPSMPILQKGIAGAPGSGYALALDGQGRLLFSACDTSQCAAPVIGSSVVSNSLWHHVAATVDRGAGQVTLYVDGAVDGTGPFFLGSLDSTADLLIGADGLPATPARFLTGYLDEIEIFNRALAPAEISAIHVAGTSGKCKCVDPPADLAAWYRMDETAGSTSRDTAGSPGGPHDATYVAGTSGLPTPGVGFVDAALQFQGLNDRVEAPDHPELDFQFGPLSIDGWIKSTAPSDKAAIVWKWNTYPTPDGFCPNSNEGYGLWLFPNFGGGLEFRLGDGASCNHCLVGFGFADGNWHHFAVTVEALAPSQGVRFYRDGVFVGNCNFGGQVGPIDNTSPLVVGSSAVASPAAGFNGSIDELEIIHRVLSPQDVAALAQRGDRGKCKCTDPPPDMVAWWPLDETLGSTAEDIALNNDGTYMGTPPPAPAGGIVSGALSFSGTTDFVRVPDDPSLDFGPSGGNQGDFTIDAWVNTEQGAGTGIVSLLDKRTFTPTRGYTVFLINGNLSFQLADAGGAGDFCGSSPSDPCRNYGSSAFVATGDWMHIAVSVDRESSTGIRFYVNGSQVATFDPTTKTGSLVNAAPLDLARHSGGGSLFRGLLDEVEIFHRALSGAEIQSIYRAEEHGKCKRGPRPCYSDIFIDKLVSNANPPLNGLVTFTVVVSNNGPCEARDILVSDVIPPGLQYVSHSVATSGASYNTVTGQLQVSTLPPQTSTALFLTVKVKTCTPVTNCASLIGLGTIDPNPANNQDCVTVTPQPASCAQLGGIKFRDDDRDGVKDTGEPTIQNQTMLFKSGSALIQSQATNASGQYLFQSVVPGTYKVTEVLQPGQVAISPSGGAYTQNVPPGGNISGLNFGNYTCPPDPPVTCIKPPAGMVEWWPLDSIVSGGAGCAYTIGMVRNLADRVFGSPAGASACGLTSPGAVDGAVAFDGVDDYVEAPDHPTLNIGASTGSTGQGDFSIDAWIRTSSTALQIIVDKRTENSGPVQGYSFFTQSGRLFVQLSSGGGVSNYDSGGPLVNTNVWTHVAVTVDRDVSTGIKFYVNGALAPNTGNPLARSGTLTNPRPLRISRRSDSTNPGFFTGGIDEVEIFRRVLSQQEIQDIMNLRKCKRPKCHTQWDIPMCKKQKKVTTPITICNYSGVPDTFTWSLAGSPPSGACTVTPTSFTPVAGTTPVLNPGQCYTVSVTIDRPAGLVPPKLACFQLTFVQNGTGQCFHCAGSIKATKKWCPRPRTGAFEDVLPVTLDGAARRVEFTVENTQGAEEVLDPDLFDYQIRVENSDMVSPNGVVRLNGLPPGTPVTGGLRIAPGDSATIGVDVSYDQHDTFEFYDVLVASDDDGDGSREDLSSTGVRSVAQGAMPQPCGGALPSATIGVGWTSSSRLAWSPEVCSTLYNAYRATTNRFLDGNGDGLADDYGACFQDDLALPEVFDDSDPPGASFHAYLITGENAQGEGTLGTNRAGATRPNTTPCP